MTLEHAPAKAARFTMQPAGFILSRHARNRMDKRRISRAAVDAALRYGRKTYARGAVFYAIGRKEVEACRRHGIDIRAHRHVQVVCSPDGVVLTVYRSGNFRPLRGRK